MQKFILIITLFLSGASYAQNKSTLEAQNWLSRMALQTLLALTENHKDIDRLSSNSLQGQPFSNLTISQSLFESILDVNSNTDSAYAFQIKVARNEILAKLIKRFKEANKIEYYKINQMPLLDLEVILVDLIEKIYLFRKMSVHGNNLATIHPKTLENIALAFDKSIDSSLQALALFIVGEKGSLISRTEIIEILKNFNDTLKLTLPTNSYSNLQDIELATAVTRHITGAYRWNRSSFQKIFSCRRFFTK